MPDWGWITLGAAILTVPTNWVVRGFLVAVGTGDLGDARGLGRWIGILERLLVYAFVVAGEPAAAALVVAAKSILRYPEISGEHPKLPAEYVLVGSLASWLAAVAVGFGVRSLL